VSKCRAPTNGAPEQNRSEKHFPNRLNVCTHFSSNGTLQGSEKMTCLTPRLGSWWEGRNDQASMVAHPVSQHVGPGGQLPAASSRTGWLKMTGSQASDGDYPSKCVRKHPQGPNVGGGVGNEVPRSDMVAVGRAWAGWWSARGPVPRDTANWFTSSAKPTNPVGPCFSSASVSVRATSSQITLYIVPFLTMLFGR
jgi:hypothetical protein